MQTPTRPGDQPTWSVYSKLYQQNQQFLWGILDQLSKQTADRNPNQQKIGDYFNACMDEAAVNQLIQNGTYTKILTKWGVLPGAVTTAAINDATS